MEVAVFEIEFSQKELEDFSNLCKHLNKDFEEVVRMCMNERCNELLDTFKHNVPQLALEK